MKKIYTLSLLIATCVTFAQASDPFNYTGVVNANGWNTHSGISGQIMTLPGSLNYPGLTSAGNKIQIVAGNTEDINLASAAPLTGVAYYSALINVPNTTGFSATTTTGNYFLMFGTLSSTVPPTLSVFSARIYIKTGSTVDNFNLGILNGSGGTAAPTFSTTDYLINTTLFLVVKYDLTTNTASLFVNPTIGGTEGTPTVTNNTGTGTAAAQVTNLAIREASGGTGNILIDEVRIGGTYAYVTGNVLKNNQYEIAGLNIYPNPISNGILNVKSDSIEPKNVVIFDVLGKQVLNTIVTNQPVSVANLDSGVYIVKVTEEGKTATKKLIIK